MTQQRPGSAGRFGTTRKKDLRKAETRNDVAACCLLQMFFSKEEPASKSIPQARSILQARDEVLTGALLTLLPEGRTHKKTLWRGLCKTRRLKAGFHLGARKVFFSIIRLFIYWARSTDWNGEWKYNLYCLVTHVYYIDMHSGFNGSRRQHCYPPRTRRPNRPSSGIKAGQG